MFFYVFIDPETVTAAATAGEESLGQLINFLHQHRYDCIMTETDLWRVGRELEIKVKAITHQHERKLLLELIAFVANNGPHVFIQDDDEKVSLMNLLLEKATEYEIELILSPGAVEVEKLDSVEISSLSKLYDTQFEEHCRQFQPCVIKGPGQEDAATIWDKHFLKLVRHSECVQMVDYSFGKYFGLGHKANIEKWALWLNIAFRNPEVSRLKIHTYDKATRRSDLETHINQLKRKVDFEIELKFYSEEDDFPHERFLCATNRWMQIGRGIDLFDENEECRDIAFSHAKRPANIH